MAKKTGIILSRTFGIILIVVGFLIGLGGGVTAFEEPKFIPASEISYKQMENFEYYNFEEITIIDCYLKNEYYYGIPDEWFYLVAFDDVDGNVYFATLIVTEEKDAFDKLRDYAENKDMLIGDCVINAVVESAYPIEEAAVFEDKDIEQYKNAVSNFKNGDVIDSGYSFEYSCTPEHFEKYADEQLNEDRYMFVGGVIGCIIGIVLVIIGFRKSLKEVDAQQNAFNQYGQNINNSAGTYYVPPIFDNNFNE